MSVLCVLPARIASERLPRKPLQVISGKTLIEWSWRAAHSVPELDEVWVATDSREIRDCVNAFGGKVVMTSPDHVSGTDRVAEAVRMGGARPHDTVVNFQPDEPFTRPEAVSAALRLVVEGVAEISTLAAPIRSAEEWRSESVVKLARAVDGRALYFSRGPIPHRRGGEPEHSAPGEPGSDAMYLQHLGLYVYTNRALQRWVGLPPSPLEELERLEQLRPLEAGMTIHVVVIRAGELGIDEPADLVRAERLLGPMNRNRERESDD
jgi:3-deoxy-manno-octulosonate cytidylyltransferase (CMP-KDO synthetase)